MKTFSRIFCAIVLFQEVNFLSLLKLQHWFENAWRECDPVGKRHAERARCCDLSVLPVIRWYTPFCTSSHFFFRQLTESDGCTETETHLPRSTNCSVYSCWFFMFRFGCYSPLVTYRIVFDRRHTTVKIITDSDFEFSNLKYSWIRREKSSIRIVVRRPVYGSTDRLSFFLFFVFLLPFTTTKLRIFTSGRVLWGLNFSLSSMKCLSNVY